MARFEASSVLPGVSLIIDSLDEVLLELLAAVDFWFHNLCRFLGTASRRSGEALVANLGLDLGTLTALISNSVVTSPLSLSVFLVGVELVVTVLAFLLLGVE